MNWNSNRQNWNSNHLNQNSNRLNQSSNNFQSHMNWNSKHSRIHKNLKLFPIHLNSYLNLSLKQSQSQSWNENENARDGGSDDDEISLPALQLRHELLVEWSLLLVYAVVSGISASGEDAIASVVTVSDSVITNAII